MNHTVKQHNYLRERVLIKKGRHHNQSDGLIYKRVCRYFPCYMNIPPLSSRTLFPRTDVFRGLYLFPEQYHAFVVFPCFQNRIMLLRSFPVFRTVSCFRGLSLFFSGATGLVSFLEKDSRMTHDMLQCRIVHVRNFLSYCRFSMRIKYGSSILGMDVEVFY